MLKKVISAKRYSNKIILAEKRDASSIFEMIIENARFGHFTAAYEHELAQKGLKEQILKCIKTGVYPVFGQSMTEGVIVVARDKKGQQDFVGYQ